MSRDADVDADDDLRDVLAGLPPSGRDLLRRVLVSDHTDRDVIAKELRRYRDQVGDDLADTIDLCTLYPKTRGKVVRMPAEIDAGS